jgi:SAM-dependent methyltransferase
MNTETNLEYFVTLWEDHKPEGTKYTSKLWNNRADDWNELLRDETPFKKSLDERVSKVANHLRNRGLLGKDFHVVDIGCGPGRFVVEFAKTADHVLGVDHSDNMLAYAKDYARSIGLENTSYHVCDFKEVDIEKLGWVESFDLVFTSITPAIGDMKSLKKAIKMSRAYCFNSCFIQNKDNLETMIAEELFSLNLENKPKWDGSWFYSLFNILWLEGYYPETFYHKQDSLAMVPVDDELIRYFTLKFSKNFDMHDESIRDKIRDYLHSKAKKDGTIEQHTERLYGWTLWDVRNKGSWATEDAL